MINTPLELKQYLKSAGFRVSDYRTNRYILRKNGAEFVVNFSFAGNVSLSVRHKNTLDHHPVFNKDYITYERIAEYINMVLQDY